MAKSSLVMTIKTPHSTIKPKDMGKVGDIFFEEIEKRAIKEVINNVSLSVRTAINRSYTIAATFFQRVCARTPLDEDYLIGFKEDGTEIWHRADKTQCRMDWYAECNGKSLSARQIADEFPEIFDEYNNSQSIDLIKEMMEEKFAITDPKVNITFSNSNPYFATLEYGGYKSDSETKTGIDKGLEHGVRNKHSVQAPVGMLRITQMELEDMVRSSAKTSLAKRYRGQRTTKEISDAKLKTLIRKFKASKRLPLSDIKEYVGL